MKLELFIEIDENKVDHKTLIAKAKEAWVSDGKLIRDIANLELYYKPSERVCYYVINGDTKGEITV